MVTFYRFVLCHLNMDSGYRYADFTRQRTHGLVLLSRFHASQWLTVSVAHIDYLSLGVLCYLATTLQLQDFLHLVESFCDRLVVRACIEHRSDAGSKFLPLYPRKFLGVEFRLLQSFLHISIYFPQRSHNPHAPQSCTGCGYSPF